jgi:hypothetical protein
LANQGSASRIGLKLEGAAKRLSVPLQLLLQIIRM